MALADLHLGSLADNGGSTQTIALGSGSAAIDAGLDAVCAAAPVNGKDQRGVKRPGGAHCDAGAYEASTPTVASRMPKPGATGVARTTTVVVTFSEPVTGVSASSFVLRDKATGKPVKASVAVPRRDADRHSHAEGRPRRQADLRGRPDAGDRRNHGEPPRGRDLDLHDEAVSATASTAPETAGAS